ncbi:hypothetical protein [Enterococcus sp. LJL51]|uniref:hypothetical protein n=1 Tax=Enterococcus sp. LJL51 TaxID=3416656 RepID=UPI003CEEADAD
MPEQKFYDTQPTGENHEVDYRDPTDVEEVEEAIKFGVVDELTQKFALWIRTKMWRRHVREALARMIEYTNVLYNKIKDISENTQKRQAAVEKRQTDLEARMKEVIGNATVDSEVIHARSSEKYGDFAVLDDRLEHIEQLLIQFVPAGFDVTIMHNSGLQPNINVRSWTHGIGVMPLGTESAGLFGGSASQSVACQVSHVDGNTSIVSLPVEYTTDSEIIKIEDDKFLLIDEITYRSILFELY